MPEPRPVTASMLYDMVTCERRIAHDLHADPAARDPVNQFVQMLWDGGTAHEREVLAGIRGNVVDIGDQPDTDRTAATTLAMTGGADVILGSRIEVDDLVGKPDVLRRVDGVWRAGDVKSGGALDPDGRRPRLAYAVQVALYAMILQRSGHGDGGAAFIVDRHGETVDYDLDAPHARDGRSVADIAAGLVDRARAVRDGAATARGALSATCKLCCWRTACTAELRRNDDLTLVAGLGRAIRDPLEPVAPTVAALAELDLRTVDAGRGRSSVPGLGLERLGRFRDRARLLRTAGATPYARRPLGLARAARELHFDIESDPSRDGLVYLHGIVERVRAGGVDRETFVSFLADGETGEREAFAAAFAYLSADPGAKIYYYSRFERSAYRDLQRRHPDVCSPEDVELLFDPTRAVDLLFDVVMPHTEWPTNDLSIKTLARHLGFRWRDADAGGANSIAWYDEHVRTGDPAVLRRILEYNHDDCRATAVLLDGLIAMPVRDGPRWPPDAPAD